MRECSMNSAHFTVRASGEIFLALNGLSFTVQISTRKPKYDVELISYGFTHHSFRKDVRHILMPVQVPLTQ